MSRNIIRFLRIGFYLILLGTFPPFLVQAAVGPDWEGVPKSFYNSSLDFPQFSFKLSESVPNQKTPFITPSGLPRPLFRGSEGASEQKAPYVQIAKPLRIRHHGLPQDSSQSAEGQQGVQAEPDEIPGLEFDEHGQAIPKGHKRTPPQPSNGSGRHTQQGESGVLGG